MAMVVKMMGLGEFELAQEWDDDGVRIEYWLGVSNNGACVRVVNPDGTMTITHHHDKNDAMLALSRRLMQIGSGPQMPATQ
jgi:hypothetical protein